MRGNSAGPSNPLGVTEETIRLKPAVAVCPEASETFAVTGYDPISEVVPLIKPVEACSWIPDGRAPVARLHWYGATPPVAESMVVYGVPTSAKGRAEV